MLLDEWTARFRTSIKGWENLSGWLLNIHDVLLVDIRIKIRPREMSPRSILNQNDISYIAILPLFVNFSLALMLPLQTFCVCMANQDTRQNENGVFDEFFNYIPLLAVMHDIELYQFWTFTELPMFLSFATVLGKWASGFFTRQNSIFRTFFRAHPTTHRVQARESWASPGVQP